MRKVNVAASSPADAGAGAANTEEYHCEKQPYGSSLTRQKKIGLLSEDIVDVLDASTDAKMLFGTGEIQTHLAHESSETLL